MEAIIHVCIYSEIYYVPMLKINFIKKNKNKFVHINSLKKYKLYHENLSKVVICKKRLI